MSEKQYKNTVEVRAAMALVQREYRLRKKVREAQVLHAEAPLTRLTPLNRTKSKQGGFCINE